MKSPNALIMLTISKLENDFIKNWFKRIDQNFGEQKSVSLSTLVKKGLNPVSFDELKIHIDTIINQYLSI